MAKKKEVKEENTETPEVAVVEEVAEEPALDIFAEKAKLAAIAPTLIDTLAAFKEKVAGLSVELMASTAERFAESAKTAEQAQAHNFAVGAFLAALDDADKAVGRVGDALKA